MDFKRIKSVTFFGYANATVDSKLYKETYEVARVLAEAGLTIVNGGGPGVMRAATDGAHAGGGIAEVATFYPEFIENFEGKDPLNKADKEIILSNYVTRTMKLLELGNAYIVFNGGTGTLSEFGMAWGLDYLYFGHHKPFVLYGEQWHPIMESLVTNMLIAEQRPESLKVYKIATTPEAVLEALSRHDEYLSGKSEEEHAPTPTGETAFLD